MDLIGALGLAVVVTGSGTYVYGGAHDGTEVTLPAKYQRGMDRFESLAACKKPLKNVDGSSDLAASVECDVATGRLRLVLSSDSNYLSSLQEYLSALADGDQNHPVALPGIIHMLYPGRQLSARLARSKWQWRKDGFFRYSVSTEKIVETRDHETGMMCPGRTSGCVLSCSVVAKHALFCTFGRISLYFRIYIKISHSQGEGVLLSSAYGRRPFSSMGFPRKREL